MNLLERLVCPNCKTVGLQCCTTATCEDEPVPVNGYAVCDRCHSHYPIANHILDLAPRGAHLLTVAGRSNNAPLAPQLYEHVWRPCSLSLMTGEGFPPVREMRRVLKPDGRIVTMSLLAAESGKGKLAQRFFGMSGIRFPTRAQFNELVSEAGLQTVQQEAYGIVTFCHLERAESRSSLSQTASPMLQGTAQP